MAPRILRLDPAAAVRIRTEIARARGNEVCFLARVADDGDVIEPRVVARGHRRGVLAAVREGEAGMLAVHNHPSGDLDPSPADFHVAAELHAAGLGLAIVDNDARELYVVVEAAAPRERDLLDPAAIAAALAPGGALSQAHAAYEDRPTQRAMAEAVASLFNDGGIALAEAGTGTGKSLAYLLPAVEWAVRNRERVLVSTNTINLQEQLVGKDLPLLRSATGQSFRFALVKGRGNYVSIRRAHLAAQAQSSLFDSAHVGELDAILAWLDTTGDGSLQDLPFQPTPEVWDEVASQTDVCLRARCPHFQACFYQRARRDSAAADVLVVNHSLLLADIAVRRAQGNYTAPAVLPPYRHAVIDEAHHLEEAATGHLGAAVSRRGLLRTLARLDRRGRGILAAVERELTVPAATDLLLQQTLDAIQLALRPGIETARASAPTTCSAASSTSSPVAREGVLRLGEDFAAQPEWVENVQPSLENALVALSTLHVELQRLLERLQLDRRWADRLAETLLELQAAAGRVRAAEDALRLALDPAAAEPVPLVRWIERRGGAGEANVAVLAAPVEIGDALRDALFERAETVVLTSATLATRDGFEFLRSRLGLGAGGLRVREGVYPSPFDYAAQAVVAIPTDLPVPREADGPFDLATATVVEEMAALSDGGLFVLFTSYRAMRAVAAQLRSAGVERRWPLFVQGEGSRARLLDRFTASGRGILLGVASFWEGVDVPGDPLRGLVIAKLPFMVPNEPLTAARIEAIEQFGGSGFRDYLLPHAALRLKQGFGRLIRSRADRGAVVLLDRRVVERGYGRYLLGTLPAAPVRTGPWAELRRELEAFYGREMVAAAGTHD